MTTSEKCDVPKVKTNFIVNSHFGKKIKDFEFIQATAILIKNFPLIAKEYGARYDIPKNVLSEAARLVLSKFKHLGLKEIREAYRECAAGELKTHGDEKMWGGEFTVAQLGAVLTAYNKRRKYILNTFLAIKAENEVREAESEVKTKSKEDFEKNFPKILKNANIGIKYPNSEKWYLKPIIDWRDVPEFWYESAFKRGYIKFEDGEAVDIFEDAKGILKVNGEKFKTDAEFQKQAKINARKISVYRKIIINKNWSHE